MSGNTTDASDSLKQSNPIETSFIDIVSNRTTNVTSREGTYKVNSKQRLNILFTSEDGLGNIYTGWNDSVVDTNFKDDAYQIFRPVTLGTLRSNLFTKLDGTTVKFVNNTETHSHKICGIDGSTRTGTLKGTNVWSKYRDLTVIET